MLLALASIVLCGIWSIVYITTLYQYDVVYLGYGPRFSEKEDGSKSNNYLDEDISGYIVVELLWALI